jgi:hypothetical protein
LLAAGLCLASVILLWRGVMLWVDYSTEHACVSPWLGFRGTPQSWNLLLAQCRHIGRLHDLGVILTGSGALLFLLGLAGIAMTLAPRQDEAPPATVRPALAGQEQLLRASTLGAAPRRARWIASQTVLVVLALGALAVGAILLINGVTLWLDRAGPQLCVLPQRFGVSEHIAASVSRQVCNSIGPWRDGAILVTCAGAALALFGLGVLPASVRNVKRQFWFRAGTWVRVLPAGPLPH